MILDHNMVKCCNYYYLLLDIFGDSLILFLNTMFNLMGFLKIKWL